MKHVSMTRKWIMWSLAGVLFMVFGLVSQPAFAATKIRLQSVFPTSSDVTKTMIESFAPMVKERTNGEIDITVYPAGALAKPMETFDSVKRGVLDMAVGTGAYHASKVPEALVEFGLPASFSGPNFEPVAANQMYEFFYKWRDGIVFKTLQDVYKKHKVHLLGTGASTGYGIMTNFPIQTLADLKGKKIRTFGLFGQFIQKMGGSPVTISSSEQYLSLQRGTIDGTVYVYQTLETYNLKEVVTHVVYPPAMAVVTINCYANQKVWKKISPENQAIMEKAFLEAVKGFTTNGLETERAAVETAKKLGIKVVDLSDSDAKQMKEIGRSMAPCC